jgi:MFS family permease
MLFAFAFVEPQMVFFLYDDLSWTTVQFGVLVGVYGLSVFVGQLTLSRLSDKYARKPIIVIGVLLNATFYGALAFYPSFALLLFTGVVSGLGEALALPAVTAFVLDLTSPQHRSRVMGIKESAASLGGVVGPLLIISVSAATDARGVFLVAFGLTLVVTAMAALDLRASCLGEECRGEARAYAERRALVAQATLRGIVTSASSARKM